MFHKILVFVSSLFPSQQHPVPAIFKSPEFQSAWEEHQRREIEGALEVFHSAEDKFWRAAYPDRQPPGARKYTNMPIPAPSVGNV